MRRCTLALLVLLCSWPRLVTEGRVQHRDDAFVGYKESKEPSDTAGCRDKNENCASWASSGECEGNPGFMASSCAKACDLCSPPATGDAPELPSDWTGDVVELITSAGSIRIALHSDDAPGTTERVRKLALEKGASCLGGGCRIYRSEALPKPGAVDNYGGPGPPYALIQGSFQSTVFTSVEKEKAPLAKRGDACLIGSGPDFFIAVGPHPEWGNGHTVWGHVVGSMAAVDAIAALPVKEEVWGQTHVTVLKEPLRFSISMVES